MATVRRIDHYGSEIRGRVETGPVQFGDDWPGLFIRGDDALSLAMSLRVALDDPSDVIHRNNVADFIDELRALDRKGEG